MKIKRIEHVAVFVKDTEASRNLWQNVFGLHLEESYKSAKKPIKIAIYNCGDSLVELVSGDGPDSEHTRMVIEQKKAGVNHLCFEVEDIDEAMVELKANGITLMERYKDGPSIGHGGCRVVFLDPDKTEGCLIELAERATLGFVADQRQRAVA